MSKNELLQLKLDTETKLRLVEAYGSSRLSRKLRKRLKDVRLQLSYHDVHSDAT